MQGWKDMWTLPVDSSAWSPSIQFKFHLLRLVGLSHSEVPQTTRSLVPGVGNWILKNLFCPFTGTLNTALWTLHSSGINWINLPCAWNTIWNSKSRPAILLVCPRKRSKNSPSCSSKFRLVRSPRWTLYIKGLVRVELASINYGRNV